MGNLFDDLTIVDFTSNLAGPVCTTQFADFGAEVIKAERAGIGDDFRHIGPLIGGKHGILFVNLNRNKKSFTFDAKDPDGLEAIKRLIAMADVVIESYRPGAMAALGLGYEDLQRINPRLIMCSISGFGQTGPYRDRPGYDVLAQGYSGMMDITGEPDGPPTRIGTAIADWNGGFNAFGAICAALYHRERTGEGQYIDLSLTDCLYGMNGLVEPAAIGAKAHRTGNHHAVLAPYGVFNGKSGSIIIGALNPKLWTAVAEVMGKPELAEDPRFITVGDRQNNIRVLVREIEDWLDTFDNVDDALALLIKAGVPSGKVMTTKETLNSPQFIARDMVKDLPMPDDVDEPKTIKAKGQHLKFSRFQPERKPPPILGQDTEYVLRKLGYGEADIAELTSRWT